MPLVDNAGTVDICLPYFVEFAANLYIDTNAFNSGKKKLPFDKKKNLQQNQAVNGLHNGFMIAQIALKLAFSSFGLLGLAYHIFLFTIPNRFSMGLRSVESAAQLKTGIP